jgi:hypothetical protein
MSTVDLPAHPRDGERPGLGRRYAFPGGTWLSALFARYGAATVAHYTSLIIGVLALLVIGRNQGFFYDDWAFLVPGAEDLVNAPHVGHWSATPALAFLLVRNVFGLDSYLPFLFMALLAHLATVHLLWRIMVRTGVDRWIAGALALLMMFLGAGGENIFWAFQFGFVGALAVGLWAVLLVDNERLTPVRGIAIAALTLWAFTFSGTAIPVVGAAILVSLARHGIARTAYVFAAPLLAYLAWYIGPASSYDGSASQVVGGAFDVFIATVEYAGHMFVNGLQKLSPLPSLGIILVVVLFAWCARGRPSFTGRAAPAFALVAGAVAFALLTGYSRAGLGTENAASSRYVYLVVALVIPAFGLLATQLARRGWLRVGGALAIIAVAIAYNGSTLYREAARQAGLEEESRGRLAATLALAQDPAEQIDTDDHPVELWAPDVSVGDLLAFREAGWISDQPYDEQDLLDVGAALQIDVTGTPAPDTLVCTIDDDGAIVAAAGSDSATFRLAAGGDISVFLHAPGAVGLPLTITVEPGWWTVTNESDFDAQVSGPTGSLETCSPATAVAP